MQLNTEIMNSEVLVEAIMNNCDDIITLKDLDCRYIACNKAYTDLLRLEKSDIIGKLVGEVLPEETSKLLNQNFLMVKRTLEPVTFTYSVSYESLHKIIRQTYIPIIENGVLTKVLSISKDISQEEHLKQKYVEKIFQLNTLLEHIPLCVYMKDVNGNFITGSEMAKEFLNTGRDISVPNLVVDLDNLNSVIEEEDKYVISTKLPLDYEVVVKSVDGIDHWYQVYKAPILELNDQFSGIVVIARNIDAEKKREAQKEMFLATLTHDLKNPIQAQLMSLKLLSNGHFGNLTEEQSEILSMIIESANYMQDMLYTILRTYKFENGIIRLQKTEFNVDELIVTCLNEISALAKNKKIKIIYENLVLGRKLFADMHQLRRVIANLLNNAVNYAYSDSDVIVKISQKENNMLFEFTNYSDPIEQDIQDRIFDKYVTGSGSYQKTGIGLGLYFAKKVVDAHNGSISIESEGCVTTFKFELPINDEKTDSCVNW